MKAFQAFQSKSLRRRPNVPNFPKLLEVWGRYDGGFESVKAEISNCHISYITGPGSSSWKDTTHRKKTKKTKTAENGRDEAERNSKNVKRAKSLSHFSPVGGDTEWPCCNGTKPNAKHQLKGQAAWLKGRQSHTVRAVLWACGDFGDIKVSRSSRCCEKNLLSGASPVKSAAQRFSHLSPPHLLLLSLLPPRKDEKIEGKKKKHN